MIKKETKKEIGKYLIDVSKLIFGGMVLASVLQIDSLSKTGIMFFGIIVTILLAVAGFNLINKNN